MDLGKDMSLNYIFDLFGRCRKRKTRFTEIEEKVISLLSSFVDGTMSGKEFALSFDDIRKDFIALTKKDGQTVIDEDTPLWLNSLLGLHYMKWLKFQQLKWYFEEHPDELVGEMKSRYNEIRQMGYDEKFNYICKKVLKEQRK